ncbi:MAG: thioredoxin family protein [Planctomyces sp.]|nr:thioredoxin family protein [Planctomyces sp.]
MFPYAEKHKAGLEYAAFLDRYATPEQRIRWDRVFSEVRITDQQQSLLQSFVRDMPILALVGAWCGDCVNQCPIWERFAQVTPRIQVRYFDRDEHPDLAAELSTCGAARVPAVAFLSEDGHLCGRYGDRTLSKYRRIMSSQGGAACPTGLATPQSELEDVTQDWLNEFERIQAMLRTSGRLRQLHGD